MDRNSFKSYISKMSQHKKKDRVSTVLKFFSPSDSHMDLLYMSLTIVQFSKESPTGSALIL